MAEKKNLRLSFMGEVEEWASRRGLSTNGAISFMCREFLDREKGEIQRLQDENAVLRKKIVEVALARVPDYYPEPEGERSENLSPTPEWLRPVVAWLGGLAEGEEEDQGKTPND